MPNHSFVFIASVVPDSLGYHQLSMYHTNSFTGTASCWDKGLHHLLRVCLVLLCWPTQSKGPSGAMRVNMALQDMV